MKTYRAFDAAGNSIRVTLKELVGSGGEGCVFTTSLGPNVVAKLYNGTRGTENKYDKCRYFIEGRFDHEGIALPTHLLLDEDDAFVGYLMPKARGCTLAEIMNPLELDGEYPGLKRKHLVDVCISILEKICYLHRNGILICDINMQNILVDGLGTEQLKTYLIDCDSYQVGVGDSAVYLGEVGQPAFTPPELQEKKLDQQKRTFFNEYFAVTVLLFMILLPGQNPYAMRGGPSTQVEGVKGGLFPYPKDASGTSDKVPSKWCRYLWSYLPMGGLFWDNLHVLGSHYSPAARTDPETWLLWMRHYRRILTDGSVAKEDPEGLKAFPERPKRQQSRTVADTPKRTPSQETKPRQIDSRTKAANPYVGVGRNDPCPCGSGKKFKSCHGAPTEQSASKQPQSSQGRAPKAASSKADERRKTDFYRMIGYIKQVSEADAEEAKKSYLIESNGLIVIAILIAIFGILAIWNPLNIDFRYTSDALWPTSSTIVKVMFVSSYVVGWAYVTLWLVHRFIRRPILKRRSANFAQAYDAAIQLGPSNFDASDAKNKATIDAAKALATSRKTTEWLLSIIVAALLAFAFYWLLGAVAHSLAFSDGLSGYDNKKNGEMYVQNANGEAVIDAATESSYGNEVDFVQAVACDSDLQFDRTSWAGEQIEVAVGEPYAVRVFLRNDSEDRNAIARNVRVSRSISTADGQDIVYTFTITYGNDPEGARTLVDDVRIITGGGWSKVSTLDGQLRSPELTAQEGRGLIDYEALDTPDGCLVGNQGADGVITGGRDGYCILYFFAKVE